MPEGFRQVAAARGCGGEADPDFLVVLEAARCGPEDLECGGGIVSAAEDVGEGEYWLRRGGGELGPAPGGGFRFLDLTGPQEELREEPGVFSSERPGQ